MSADTTAALKATIQKAIREVQEIADPIEQARAASQLIDTLGGGVDELSTIRRAGVLHMRDQRMTHQQIADKIGVTRPVVSRLLAGPGVPVERQFLGGPVLTVAVGGKLETGRRVGGDQPMLSTMAMAAYEVLADMARSVGLEPTVEIVPPPGHVDLNRANLLVLTAPRLLPFVQQVQAADPWYRFAEDERGWHLVNRATGEEYRSPFDEGRSEDYAYLGRLPRPDGQGTFVYVAGVHAPGTLGAAVYLSDHLADLYRQFRLRRFSMLLRCTYSGEKITEVDELAPARTHESTPA